MARASRPVAAVWLIAIAPLELASSLAGLVSRPDAALGAAGIALVAGRILAASLGLILGRQLLVRAQHTRPLALSWAALDLVTLTLALATRLLPSSRMPGDAPVVWVVYAVAALAVVLASER